MKTIYSNQYKFQTFLDALIFLFRLLFTEPELPETKPYVFVSPAPARRIAVECAARRFELKKRGLLK